jgi:hypothetical protein
VTSITGSVLLLSSNSNPHEKAILPLGVSSSVGSLRKRGNE